MTVVKMIWHASCSCGWSTEVANDADTAMFKIRTHVKAFHAFDPADINVKGVKELRASPETVGVDAVRVERIVSTPILP